MLRALEESPCNLNERQVGWLLATAWREADRGDDLARQVGALQGKLGELAAAARKLLVHHPLDAGCATCGLLRALAAVDAKEGA